MWGRAAAVPRNELSVFSRAERQMCRQSGKTRAAHKLKPRSLNPESLVAKSRKAMRYDEGFEVWKETA